MRAWIILLTSSLFYFYQSLIRVSSSGIGFDLIRDFSVSGHRLGNLSAAFFLSYTLMQIPVGITLDRFGVRRLLPWMTLICGAGCIFFALSPYFWMASISRLFTGFAAAFAFIGCIKLINNWFPNDKLSMLTGAIFAIGSIGAILGEEPFSYLVDYIGWRYSMFLLGIFGMALSTILFFVIKDAPSGECIILQRPWRVYKKELKEIFHHKQLWLITAYSSFVSMPIYTLSSLWGVPFIMARYNVTNIKAATAVSFIFLGCVLGSSFWGGWSDYLKRRIPFLFIAAIAPSILLLIIIYYPFNHFAIPCTLLFAFGFFNSAYLSSYAMVCEISKLDQVGTSLGMVNMMNNLLVTFSLPFLGRLLDVFWSGNMEHGVRVYALVDYQISMTFIVVLIAISLFFLYFIKETHGKPLFPKEG
jgi:sugar phosphate permease